MSTGSYDARVETWFDIVDGDDGQFDVGTLSTAEQLFVDSLRRRTSTWNPTGCSSFLTRDCDSSGPLIAVLYVGGGTVGVHFDGGSIRCDGVHNQLFHLAEKPTTIALDAHGTPAELGDLAAAWFEAQR